jgi:hypothetical protein
MKKIVLITLSFVVYSCGTTIDFSKVNEPVNNFRTIGGNVLWENIYDYSPSDSLNVISWFKNKFEISFKNESSIFGQSRKETLPYKKAGYSAMNVIIFLQHPCEVFFTVDFKDNRYRVIVNKILWYPAINANYGAVSTNSNLIMSLDEVAHNSNGYNSTFINRSSKQINDMLSVMFEAHPVEVSEDW